MDKSFEELSRDVREILDGGGFRFMADRMVLEVTGNDRAKFLHSMVTADVKNLAAGKWTPASLLTSKGKLMAEMELFNLGEQLWLETDAARIAVVEETLRKYKLGADVTFDRTKNSRPGYWLVGEASAGLFPESKAVGEVRKGHAGNREVWVAGHETAEKKGFKVMSSDSSKEELESWFRSKALREIRASTWEALRIEAGIPKFGVDIGEENLLHEVPYLLSGVSYTKGCYVGQETVARLHARGENVAKKLVGVMARDLEGTMAGGKVSFQGEEVGAITSDTYSPHHHARLGLAMVHRKAFAPGTAVEVEIPGTRVNATIVEFSE